MSPIKDLQNNAVTLHQALSRLREDAAVDADLESATAASPTSLLQVMRSKLRERLGAEAAGRLTDDVRGRLADGEVARLIGECPIEWRDDKS